ncbi:short-chain dehydrogenase/reductase SDR [Segniliparus rotundus DSM 44985]|uniref:Short-chain dehydrogenase/reductase SDR n=1 Tax=Segniliparus rotundus (strain ATCC BAA-972 / CDC 1076 / CIP 108378 / DSM 44985 / JCM 13578) TaxID=640132 RepID=D6Z849_SEGRD|nr:SDR family NAD(P)-dependent oxidoreductase [Segniliparus rotundus]ADG98129.1 short-chain dehydrogenase/reductase SDR [Segniliparus rotundus DSM 44985]
MSAPTTLQRAEELLMEVVGPRRLKSLDKLSAEVRGKVALVTGASFGQGEATAKLLARAGAVVVIAARTKERLDEIVAEIQEQGGQAHAYQVDMGDLRAVDQFAADVLADHGHVDYLVHNAGKSLRRSIYLSCERPKDMDAMVGVNFLGPMRLTMALLPSMRERRSGHIVNICTAGVLFPVAPRWGFYQACKAGFDVWLRSVAMETRADGIGLSTVYAGHLKTRMVATGWVHMTPGHTPEQAAQVIARSLVSKPRIQAPYIGRPSEIAAAIFRTPLEMWLGFVNKHTKETEASIRAFEAAKAKLSEQPAR